MSLTLASFTLAEGEKELETAYPTVPEAQTPTKVTTPLPEYVRYLFNFSIWIAGFVAFATLIYGGVRYITSAGSPSATADARGQIFAGILGLIIIISAYAILVNINPQLVILRVDYEGAPAAGETLGVYLCKNASLDTENCVVYTMSSDTIDPNFDDEVKHVYLKNEAGTDYGVVLHRDKGRQGTCQVILNDGPVNIKASSITVFRQTQSASGRGVTIYDGKNYQEGKFGHIGPYNSQIVVKDINEQLEHFDNEASSVEIDGNYLVILSKNKDIAGNCLVLTQSDPYLKSEGFDNNVKSFRVLFIK